MSRFLWLACWTLSIFLAIPGCGNGGIVPSTAVSTTLPCPSPRATASASPTASASASATPVSSPSACPT
ncbi:MAG: hypothetical protein IAI50_18100 [Candidatus Eremiobacteraeota bacterium]|nr:hypothetical protein [Candidatus Eremiobacteraeota bacterium]